MENVYTYIAKNNPKKAIELLDAYGYNYADTPDLGLSQLVTAKGEKALKKIMEIHPDKDIILECFGTETDDLKPKSIQDNYCNCPSCRIAMHKHDPYLNASGATTETVTNDKNNQNQNTLAMQTNIIIGVTALFFATALFLKNN